MAEIIWKEVGPFYETLQLGEQIIVDGIKTPYPKIEYYNAPKYKYLHYCIGYSFSTSMLQLLRAFATLFTGKMYNPSILVSPTPKEPLRLMEFNNKKIILDALLGISDSNPILKKYQVYGKTGTARINVNGVYVPNLVNTFYICSFIKNHKRYFMLLCMEKPQSRVIEASGNVKLIAAYIIKNILQSHNNLIIENS